MEKGILMGIVLGGLFLLFNFYQNQQMEKRYEIVSIQDVNHEGDEKRYFELQHLEGKDQLTIYLGEMASTSFRAKVKKIAYTESEVVIKLEKVYPTQAGLAVSTLEVVMDIVKVGDRKVTIQDERGFIPFQSKE